MGKDTNCARVKARGRAAPCNGSSSGGSHATYSLHTALCENADAVIRSSVFHNSCE
jgi:hypothetical protein